MLIYTAYLPTWASYSIAHINRSILSLLYVLTVAQVCEVTGYQRHTILKWCSKGLLKTILQTPKYMIPKVWLLEFVASDFFNEISRKCGKHYAAIKEISSSRKAR